jgi:hypothetical protein
MALRVRGSSTPGKVQFDVGRATLDRLRDMLDQSADHEVEAVVGTARFLIDYAVLAFLRYEMARAGDYELAASAPDLRVTLFTRGKRSTLWVEAIAVEGAS